MTRKLLMSVARCCLLLMKMQYKFLDALNAVFSDVMGAIFMENMCLKGEKYDAKQSNIPGSKVVVGCRNYYAISLKKLRTGIPGNKETGSGGEAISVEACCHGVERHLFDC